MNKVLLIVPCYNEEKRFNIHYWKEISDGLGNVNFLFVDDGSTDNTFMKIEELSTQTNCFFQKIEKNSGKGKTLKNAFSSAVKENYEIIGFIDSDGAFKLNDIKRIVILAEQLITKKDFEAVFSSRINLAGRNIKRKKSRHYISRAIYTIINLIIKIPLYDTQSGFKLYENSLEWRKVFKEEFKTRWFFDIETLTLFRKLHNRNPRTWEEPLDNWSDVPGSSLSKGNTLRILRDIFIILRMK